MDPLLRLWIPAATRRNDMQMRIVASIPAMGLEHDDIAAFEGSATDPAEDIIQASHPTTHERTQHRLGLLIKRWPEELRHPQDNMAGDEAPMGHLVPIAYPPRRLDTVSAQ